jgi:hypothetical protein
VSTAMSNHLEASESKTNNNILDLADSFIDQMLNMTNILKLVSVSSLVMLTIALGLMIYLVYHPLFANMLATSNDIRLTLSILTVTIIAIFSVGISNSIRQYRIIDNWKKRYQNFILIKNELDKRIEANLTHGST